MKYFIYKGTGGLFHNLKGLSRAIQLSIEYKAILIIDMKIHRPFGGNFNDYFTLVSNELEYYDNYEKVPKELIENVKTKNAKFFGYYNKNITEHSLGFSSSYRIDQEKDVNVLYGACGFSLSKVIKVNNQYFNNITSNNLPIKENYISVHFRNTDIKNEIDNFYLEIEKAVKKHNIYTLYLATDDYSFYENIHTKFPELQLIQKTQPLQNVKNLHYGTDNPKKQMYECLQDVYYILLSDVFIPSRNSGFSKCIIEMIKKKFTIFPDVISKTIIE